MSAANIPAKLTLRGGQPTPGAAAARLLGLVNAAQTLTESLEDGADTRTFALVTALQCVLDDAQDLAVDLSEDIDVELQWRKSEVAS